MLAAVLMLWSCAAYAVTLTFDEYVTGEDLGETTLATLEITETADGVQFTLTNVAVDAGIDAFLTQLFLTYESSTAGLTLTDDGGVATDDFTTNDIINASFDFQIIVEWETSNRGGGEERLEIGESSTFTIVGATLDDFLSDDDVFAMIHIQGLDGGGSTKYTATIPPIPLPAAGGLLLAALGALAIRRRREQATV